MKSKPTLVAQLVKNLPAMQETWVLSLGWEVPMEKRKATQGRNESDTTEWLSLSLIFKATYRHFIVI